MARSPVTVAHVRDLFDQLINEARLNGLPCVGWRLQEASREAGRPFRLFGPNGSTLRFTTRDGFLGDTSREAAEALRAYAGGMYAIRDQRAREDREKGTDG